MFRTSPVHHQERFEMVVIEIGCEVVDQTGLPHNQIERQGFVNMQL